MPEFEKKWNDAGLSDSDLLELQAHLCKHPQSGPVIPGTGGLRKLRWHTNKGKRAGIRTIYVDFMRFEKLYLITAYTKNGKDNLTYSEKRSIKELITVLENNLERKYKK